MPTTPTSAPILLVPPSEGKAHGGRGRGWRPDSGSCSALAAERAEVVRALDAVDGGDAKLIGLTGANLDSARHANRSLVGAPTLPAWQRYTGVVWEHLEPQSLDAAQRRRLFIPSGLLGLSRGDDPTPDYRLKMGARLGPLGLLSRWWQPTVTAAIDRRCRGRFVVDLLPVEHRASWTPGPGVQGVRVEFVDRSGRAGGHFAKAAKGRLARQLLIEGTAALDHWSDDRFELALTEIGTQETAGSAAAGQPPARS